VTEQKVGSITLHEWKRYQNLPITKLTIYGKHKRVEYMLNNSFICNTKRLLKGDKNELKAALPVRHEQFARDEPFWNSFRLSQHLSLMELEREISHFSYHEGF
jgi:hypothetical protein